MDRLIAPGLLLAALAFAGVPAGVSAQSAPVSHVRVDPELQDYVVEAAQSPAFRALVSRLNNSDVVVYIRCRVGGPNLAEGLRFVSTNPPFRYVVVDVNCQRPESEYAGLMGHELQHAVEVAADRDVVDTYSFTRLFQRIGYFTSTLPGHPRYDTDAAVTIGIRVEREVAEAARALAADR